MWQNIIVIAIVAVTAGLVAWQFYRKLTGRSSGCGGCSGAGSSCCGSGGNKGAGGANLRQLNGSGCGCGH
jgi:hypothetical protein